MDRKLKFIFKLLGILTDASTYIPAANNETEDYYINKAFRGSQR